MGYKETCEKCKKHYENAKQHPTFWILFGILLAVILLIWLPPLRVSHFEINNATVEATLENQYRATLAQILGGVAIGISLYYTHKRVSATEKNIIIAQEGQITERFTRAVDQLGAIDHLGNPALEIRLGGIYALERISNESKKDYWPIMEILTAYVRKNSSNEIIGNKKATHLAMDIQANESITNEVQKIKKVTLDTQAILTVLRRRIHSLDNGETTSLNLRGTCLQEAYLEGAHLKGAHLEEANLNKAHLEEANLNKAHLEEANLNKARLEEANLKEANLNKAHLEGANLVGTHLEEAYLNWVHLELANLYEAHLEDANLYEAHLEGAILIDAHLEGAKLINAHLEGARLERASLEGASLLDAHFEGADFEETNLNGAYLKETHLLGAHYLSFDQLSKVKTLYKAELDKELDIPLREKYPALFEKPNDNKF